VGLAGHLGVLQFTVVSVENSAIAGLCYGALVIYYFFYFNLSVLLSFLKWRNVFATVSVKNLMKNI